MHVLLKVTKKRHDKRNNHLAENSKNNYDRQQHQPKSEQKLYTLEEDDDSDQEPDGLPGGFTAGKQRHQDPENKQIH